MATPKWTKPYTVLQAKHRTRLTEIYCDTLAQHEERRVDVAILVNKLAVDFEASPTSVRSRIDRAARSFIDLVDHAARLSVLQDALRQVDRKIEFDEDGGIVEREPARPDAHH